MISNRDAKFIKSLQLKKFRILEKRFLVEGEKSVCELIKSDFEIDKLFVTQRFVDKNSEMIESLQTIMSIVSQSDLEKVGSFKSNDAALAVVHIREIPPLDEITQSILAFDRIKDPGNLGTVIRIADWYGFKDIVCSPDSVDCYNPKVVSSTMGSFARVNVHYQDLSSLLDFGKASYGAALDGQDLHEISFDTPAILLFGNESQGIAPELLEKVTEKVRISGYGAAESLNVSVSTAVFCDNFKRITKS